MRNKMQAISTVNLYFLQNYDNIILMNYQTF